VRITSRGFPVYELKAKGLAGQSFKNFILAVGRMVSAIFRAWRLLKEVRPDAVAGFGSYGAFPIVFAALLQRTPVLIHEQNVRPGRANALLARWVNKVAISFPQGQKYFPSSAKVVLTGCPAKQKPPGVDRESLFQRFGLKSSGRTILILGGSQGSRRINAVFIETALILKKECHFQVIHVAGKEDVLKLRQHYEYLQVPHYVCDFMDDIEKAYVVADLAISRAGAVSVTELKHFGIPSILIPYPFAGGHQKENALVLVESRQAAMIEEGALSPLRLRDMILSFLRAEREPFMPGAACSLEGAGERIAREIVSLKKI
jgi:UDP-N-acetylglucosamine--N-acetylmuramyl-(pentapeptide) pyrophosphoryl-undecaprenol N-acetylglucosamine transferase